ncbi:16S rRNA (cytidine(1402)-2'-O)-methyltransferase [Erysipelotrichaceae bacterium RD49]|nr:16S rRNA (cytidine(1402)-2'-O)-methyltransferase [Erysipelotrichaceae bacterium RD49]
MNRQKSFQNEEAPALYLVPTPIGNRFEVSERTLAVLNGVDVIACEDTRNSGQLLKSLGISKPLISHHEFNAASSVPGIIQLLDQGKKVAIISDAGYPLISDPGAMLVQEVIKEDYPVISISGPNAALDALVASGLSTQHYLYYGFLDSKPSKRKKELQSLKAFPWTLIFYEAPHRIQETLEDILEELGDRKICLARELTKLHEEYLRGTVSEILAVCEGLKGEMVLVVEGNTEKSTVTLEEVTQKAMQLASEGLKPKQAAAAACEGSDFSKNEVYAEMMKRK